MPSVGAANHGYVYERRRLSVTRETLLVSGLSAELAGLRIGFLTDLHRSDTVTDEMADAAVQLLHGRAARHHHARRRLRHLGRRANRRFVEAAAEALAPLTAPHGVFAVLGNHDDDHDMPAALAAKGFTVLRDARTRVEHQRRARSTSPASASGRARQVDIARVVRAQSPTSSCWRTPRRDCREAAALAVPLVLSGHTHGGQIVLPGIGAIAAREFPVVEGMARQQATAIFVSRGVGTVYIPVRLNCPPEVALLTLEPFTRLA